MGTIIDVGKGIAEDDKKRVGNLMSMMNPQNLIKQATKISKDLIEKRITKKVVIEQASNGFLVTFFSIQEEKKVYSTLNQLNKDIEKFFKNK